MTSQRSCVDFIGFCCAATYQFAAHQAWLTLLENFTYAYILEYTYILVGNKQILRNVKQRWRSK